MALRALTISLNNPTKTYAPGDLVTGDVIIELNWPAYYQGLQLRFTGEALVHWLEGIQENDNTQEVPYQGQEEYLRTTMYLFGSPGGNVRVDAGRLVLPFTFSLPMDIPSSFYNNPLKFDLGVIEYSIEAILSDGQGSDPTTKIVFFVSSPPDSSLYPIKQEPIVDEVNESYCCCLLPCISRGSMNATIRASSNTYAVGDDIIVLVDIDCNSNAVDVTSVNVKLEQRMTFTARTPELKSKCSEKVVAESTHKGPIPSAASLELKMKVPSVNHTGLKNCGIIAIKYLLKVEICVSGCHVNTRKEYDIVIGSRSPIPTIPIAPSAPIIGPIGFTSSGFASSNSFQPPLHATNVPYSPEYSMYPPYPSLPAGMMLENRPPPYQTVYMQGGQN